MTEAKQLAGVLNLDDPFDVTPMPHHVDARNVTFRGMGNNMRVQNVFGTTLVPNASLPATGINRTIGTHYDQVKGRLFIFNWNSTNKHGIYIYYTATGNFVPLIINTVGTTSDAFFLDLRFSCIHNGIIYGDSVQGDILYFLDGAGKPSKINIDLALAGGYGTIRRSYLEVAKQPFNIPPAVCYEDDPTVTVNTMRKKLFVFKYRGWFDDHEKATWSQHSEVPLPLNPFSTVVDPDPTKNADIAIAVQTGGPNIKKIEIAVAFSLGNVFGDYQSIVTLDKSVLGIPDDDIYLYRFYNDKQYNFVETNTNPLLNESILLFDNVPQSAQSAEILNGNTLIYANTTEGYPNITDFTNGTLTTNIASGGENVRRTNTFFLFSVAQFGKTANGTGNTHAIVAGAISLGDQFTMFFNSDTISYTALAGDTPASVINGLRTAAITAGFSIVSFDSNNLIISKTNSVLNRFISIQSGNLNTSNSTWDAYDWSSRYGFGFVYYDDKLRTNGVVYPANLSPQTIPYTETASVIQLPNFTLNIYHRPPVWGTSYSVVRTNNLSKSKFVQWISDRTFKDTSSSSGSPLFAYISIETLNTFVADNPGSPLTYQFSAGDRITFMKRFVGTTASTIYTGKDYEVQGQVINPIINGVQETGQFVKIFLPTTIDAFFNFGSIGGGINYNNYFIELYSPVQPAADGINAFFEFSERYAVIDPGTGTQYHQGKNQNQTADLVTPAVITMDKGDDYYRVRVINTGVKIVYQIEGGFGPDSNAGQITLGAAVQSQSYNDPNIVTGNSPYNNLIGFNLSTNMTRQILSIVTGTYLFRITGTIVITWSDDRPGDSYKFSLQDNTGAETVLVPVFDNSKAGTYSFNVDNTFNLSAGQRIFIFGISIPNFDHTRSFTSTQLTVTAQQAYAQGVIDPNFSDYYKSSVNSNGRELIYDPNAATVTYPTLLRWGQSYLVDTNINQSNRFYTTDFDTIDRAKGAIRKLKVRDRILRGWQDRYCFQMGIYSKFIQDSGGQNTLTTTDSIITSNNVQYYEGEYGVMNYPESIVHGKIQDYFIDPIRGVMLRLSNDGIVNLSELYKGQYALKDLITQYNKSWFVPGSGAPAKMLGTYDYFNEEYIPVLQGGVNDLGSFTPITLAPNTFAFNEPRNAFTSFYDYNPEWISFYEDNIVSFQNGNLYIHNNRTTFSNFYGTQYDSYITLLFNKDGAIKKTFESIRYQANQYWVAKNLGDVTTSQPNPQTGFAQISKFFQEDFTIEEGVYFNSLLRDANSMQNQQVALWEGDYLKGWWVKVKLTYTGGQFAWLFAPALGYEISQRNFK
jgi:hypothetical protein